MSQNFKKVSVNSLKKGSYLIVDGAACRLVDMATSRPGKHGHAKHNIMAVGLLDDKKRNMITSDHDIDAPIIEKKTANVLSITGDHANVMDEETYETFDLAIPEELKEEISEGCNILYWLVIDEKVMKQVKSD